MTLQAMLLTAYKWSFTQCTGASTGPTLSTKERRCIASGVATYVDARSALAQSLLAGAK